LIALRRTERVDQTRPAFLVVGSGAPSFGKVESSISLVRDGSALIVIDPGMVSDRRKDFSVRSRS